MEEKIVCHKGLEYAVDTRGVSIVMKDAGFSTYLEYPDAAIWLLLVEKRGSGDRMKMLGAVLGEDADGVKGRVDACISGWRTKGLIR